MEPGSFPCVSGGARGRAGPRLPASGASPRFDVNASGDLVGVLAARGDGPLKPRVACDSGLTLCAQLHFNDNGLAFFSADI